MYNGSRPKYDVVFKANFTLDNDYNRVLAPRNEPWWTYPWIEGQLFLCWSFNISLAKR